MSMIAPPLIDPVLYPESDGLPMADNTKQFDWIVTIKCGLEAMFDHDPNVFVAGDLLWYPVQNNDKIRAAPDALVVFGRPKGPRGSYLQWLEDDIPPQVVFEVLSPGNRAGALKIKFEFYERYGVEEYYVYDPDDGTLEGWLRDNGKLKEIQNMRGWISPRLGIRFDLMNGDLCLYTPDNEKLVGYVEVVKQAKLTAQQLEKSEERAERLAAQLKALGIEPEA